MTISSIGKQEEQDHRKQAHAHTSFLKMRILTTMPQEGEEQGKQ